MDAEELVKWWSYYLKDCIYIPAPSTGEQGQHVSSGKDEVPMIPHTDITLKEVLGDMIIFNVKIQVKWVIRPSLLSDPVGLTAKVYRLWE